MNDGTYYQDCGLPLDIMLLIAEYLEPDDLVKLLRSVPGIVPLLTYRNTMTTTGTFVGDTLWHILARNGDDSLIRRLLTLKGIQPNVENDFGETPLLVAVQEGREAIVSCSLNETVF